MHRFTLRNDSAFLPAERENKRSPRRIDLLCSAAFVGVPVSVEKDSRLQFVFRTRGEAVFQAFAGKKPDRPVNQVLLKGYSAN